MKFEYLILVGNVCGLINILPKFPLYRGIIPERLDFYKARLKDEKTGLWRCANGFEDEGVILNDDYCDCEDASDEPGSSACAGRDATLEQRDIYLDESVEEGRLPAMYSDKTTSAVISDRGTQLNLANPGFYCHQEGFYAKLIPSWRVNDNICDCCDGADETPSTACPNTCATLMKEHQSRMSMRLREEEALIQSGINRYHEGVKKLQEWDEMLIKGPKLIMEAEAELDRLVQEKEANNTLTSTLDPLEELPAVAPVEELPAAVRDESEASNFADEEDDEGEWEEHWNEDGSIKRVKKAKRRRLQQEPISQISFISEKLDSIRSGLMQMWSSLKEWLGRRGNSDSATDYNHHHSGFGSNNRRNRYERNSYNDPVSVQQREVQSLKDRYNKIQEWSNLQHFRDFPQLTTLIDKSLSLRIGETTYTVPIFGSPHFRENWEEKVNLGTFKSVVNILDMNAQDWLEATIGRGVFAPWGLFYEGGSKFRCEDDRTISSLIYFVCAREDELLVFEEQQSCHYTGTIASPVFCNVTQKDQKFPIVAPSRDEL